MWGSLGLETGSFTQGLAAAKSDLTKFSGVVGDVLGTAKKIDDFITGISDGVVKTTGTVIIQTAKFAKAFDDNVMGVVDQASGVVVNAFSEMTSAAMDFVKEFMNEGMSFDTAMGQVSATLLQSRDDFDSTQVSVDGFTGSLRDFAKQMGATTKFTATQAGEALNYMALAGYDAQTSAEMLPKVLDLAAAGAMDLGTASDMVTDAQTALGLSLEDTSIMIDQMAKTASSSNTSVAQLGDAILSIGATGRQIKGGFTELNTVLGVLADNGIKASEGGNMLRRILVNLTAPTDNAKEQLDALGVSVFDAQGNMRDLPAVFSDLDKALSSLTDEERTKALSEIFSQYSLAGANALLKTSSERWEELAEKIKDSEGAAKAMAEIQLETLPGQITILQSAFSGLQTELYEKVAPMTKDFVKMLSEGLSSVTAEITNGNFEAAFSRLGITIVDLVKKGVDEFLSNTENIKSFADGALIFVQEVGNALFYAGNVILPTIVQLATDIATNFITSFSDFLSDPKNTTALEITISGILNTLKKFFEENQDDLYNIFSTLFDIGIQFVDDLFLLKRETVYSILYTKFTEILSDLTENIGEYLSDEELGKTVDNVISFFGDVAEQLLNSSAVILPKLLDFILDIGDKIITGLAEFLSDDENLDTIRGTINLLLQKIKTFLNEHEDDLYKIFSDVWDVAIGFVWEIFELRRQTVGKTLGRKIKSIWDEAWGGENGIQAHLRTVGMNIMTGLAGGLWYSIGTIKNDISDIGSTIVDAFKDFFGIASPSKLFRDEVGAFLAQGIGVGFTNEMDKVTKEMQNSLPTSFDVTPELTTTEKASTASRGYVFEFHIGTITGVSQNDALAFTENISNLLYTQTFRKKEALS